MRGGATTPTPSRPAAFLNNYGNAAAMHRLASLTSSGLGVVTYGYDTYGKLETITRGSTIYRLTYDAWNRPVQTKVGSVALSTNTYYNDGKLEEVEYANGFSARYVYDNLDRVEKIYQTEGNNTEELTYEMIYNGEGDLYEIRNYRTGRASFFDYDHAGRCMASKERAFTVTNGVITYGAILSSYGYQYDECNNLTKLTCSVLGSRWSTVYTYDGDNRAATTTLSSGKVITNTYDAIGRLTNRALGLNTTYNTALTYVPGNATNKTTGLVATYQNGSDAAYEYEYDAVGNITEITQGSTSISYEYDTANRLIRENNQVTNQTIVYDYENELWGNIRSRKIYAYTTIATDQLLAQTPTSTVNYAYTNSAWGDQLTSYAGQTITYDEMGNPTTYRGYTMAWRGKQLVSASNGTNSLTFEYNEDGLRQKKTVNNVVTDYFYNGSVLIGMQRGTMKFLFSYDAGGNVISVRYITANDTNEYYYLRNAQGDIVKLIDANGVSVVEYTYDTWGKKVTTTGTLAGTLGLFQPFRYRGYVYDWETGFYYLQSRYYDPTTGRFISADSQFDKNAGICGYNLYAYCANNPVIYYDAEGDSITLICILVGAGIGLLVGAYVGDRVATSNGYNPSDGWDYWSYILGYGLGGAAIGALAGWGVGSFYTAASTYMLELSGAAAASSTALTHTTAAARLFGVELAEKISCQGMVISLLRSFYENGKVAMGLEELSYLFNLCDYWGIKITATYSDLAGHGEWVGIPHIHVGDVRVHIALAEEAIDFIRYLIESGELS